MSFWVVGATVVAGAISGDAAANAGEKGHAAALVNKALNDVAASQKIASGQRAAIEERRQADLVASRALVVGSAQGASDDLERLTADIFAEGEYRASVAMYEAETEAQNIKTAGDRELQAQKARQSGMREAAVATTLSSTIQAFGSYKAAGAKK